MHDRRVPVRSGVSDEIFFASGATTTLRRVPSSSGVLVGGAGFASNKFEKNEDTLRKHHTVGRLVCGCTVVQLAKVF